VGVAGWLGSLFSARRQSDMPVMIAKGRGYTFNIVGESQFQDVLAQIAGPKTPDGAKVEKTAQIVDDDDNEHDESAIAVLIGGRVVGFIPRAVAASMRADLARINPAGHPITCHAKVVGGWRDADGHEAHYGVKLSISNPIRLE
jgi:hypothetical protein